MPTIQRVEAVLFNPSFNHDVGNGCCVVERLSVCGEAIPIVIKLTFVVFQDVLDILLTLNDQLIVLFVVVVFGNYF